jgi:hypothetical protein
VAVLVEILGEYPEPVPALFSLAPVGIENPEAEVRPGRRDEEQNTVGADAVILSQRALRSAGVSSNDMLEPSNTK